MKDSFLLIFFKNEFSLNSNMYYTYKRSIRMKESIEFYTRSLGVLVSHI